MPLLLFILAILFIAAGLRGKHELLLDTLKDDFTGPNNFIIWGVAVFGIYSLTWFKPTQKIAHAFLLLLLASMFLANRGFFTKFMEQIGSTSSGGLDFGSTGDETVGSVLDVVKGVLGGSGEQGGLKGFLGGGPLKSF